MPQLRMLYEQLLETPALDREDWLLRHCDDLEQRDCLRALLRTEQANATGPLDRPAADRLASFEGAGTPVNAHWIGRKVGAFRLQRMIGQGGMAVVFLARREDVDFSQQVAVKLLLRGLVSAFEQQMFRRERQALASLSHPHIARLVDGGIADNGVPYLAMEYVEGVPITQYCSGRKCDLKTRLTLFLMVCRAVEAAHRALIVHRDIKPSNILVTDEGSVKLLDFGIAKLLQGDDLTPTRTGLAVLTPEYAAPEQFDGGAVTTATDVYALGVLLYELLLGVRPKRDDTERPSARASQADTRSFPAPAQTLRRLLQGDLDNIVLKALDAEPQRRYASAGAMADDIERHLSGQPVTAHPPSVWYRTRKFIRRHRGGVALTMLLVLGVLVSLAAAIWQARWAQAEAVRANKVTGFLMNLFENTVPAQPAERMPTTADLLEQGVSEIESRQDLDQNTRIRLMTMMAVVTRQVGLDADAERLAMKILEEAGAGANDPYGDRAAALMVLSEIADSKGEPQHAVELADQAIAAAARYPELLVEAQHHAATLRFNSGATSEGIALLRSTAKFAEEQLGTRHEQAIEARKKLAFAVAASGDSAEAIELLARSLAEIESHYGSEHAKVSEVLMRSAVLEAKFDHLDTAETLARRAIAIDRSIYRRPHRQYLENLGWLSDVLRRADRTEENVAVIEEVAQLARALLPESSPSLPSYINNLGVSRLEAERPGLGEPELREALRLLQNAFGPDDARTLSTEHSLARALTQLGRASEGLPMLDAVLIRKRAVLGPQHVSILRSEIARAEALLALGQFEEAATLLAHQRKDAIGMQPMPTRELGRLDLVRIESLARAGRVEDARAAVAGIADTARISREDRCRSKLWHAQFAIDDAQTNRARIALEAADTICQLPSTRARLESLRNRLRAEKGPGTPGP